MIPKRNWQDLGSRPRSLIFYHVVRIILMIINSLFSRTFYALITFGIQLEPTS